MDREPIKRKLKKIKVFVEYEIAPLRFANIKCPSCGKLFDGFSNAKNRNGKSIVVTDKIDLTWALHTCPYCKNVADFNRHGVEVIESMGGKEIVGE